MDVTMPDGTVIQGVPEGVTQSQLLSKYNNYSSSQSSSYLGDVGSDIKNTAVPALTRMATGEQTIPETALQVAGSVPTALGGEAIKRIPAVPGATIAAQGAANAIDNTGIGQKAGDFLMEGSHAVSDWSDNHPRAAADIAGVSGLSALEAMASPVSKASDFVQSGLNKYASGLASNESGEGYVPSFGKTTAIYDPIATHAAISDSYGAAKQAARPYYNLMNDIGSGETANASSLKPALESMISDIQNTPFHEATTELSYLKQQAQKIGDDGTMPLNDMVKLKQNLNSNFNPKRFAQGSDTPYAKVGSLVDDSLSDAAQRIPEFGDAKQLADKNWLNTVKSPFEDNKILQKFWKPEDYYAKRSVDNGMLEELPDPTKERANTMLGKISTPTQLDAVRRVLPKDAADNLSQAKIQNITQGEGVGRLGAAGQVLTKGLDLTPSGIANTGRNISNIISPRYTPDEQVLIRAAKSPSPALSTKYTKPFQQLKASIQQQKDSAGEMQPVQYGPQPTINYNDTNPDINPKQGMISSLSPQERLVTQADVLQKAANRNTPNLDARKQLVRQAIAIGKSPSPVAAPIKNLQNIGPSTLSESLSKEAVNQSNEEVQSLLQQGYSLQQIKQLGYKHGGAVNTEPSEAQIVAGNYKKAHVKWNGLDITIENPKGSIRRGVDKGGKKWQVKMPTHYGYIKKTEGADGEHMDVYLGPRPASEKVWVINQKHLHNGKFDEHKVMIGFPTKGHALAAYRKAFSDGKADERIHSITECSIDELKQWLNETKKEVA